MSADASTPASGAAGIGLSQWAPRLDAQRQHAARAVVALGGNSANLHFFFESSLLNIVSLSFTPFSFGPG